MDTAKKFLWELVALMGLVGCSIVMLIALILEAISMLFGKGGGGLAAFAVAMLEKLQSKEGKYEATVNEIAE